MYEFRRKANVGCCVAGCGLAVSQCSSDVMQVWFKMNRFDWLHTEYIFLPFGFRFLHTVYACRRRKKKHAV